MQYSLKKNTSYRAFSLIEISVTLAVIGLLAGVVISGTHLLHVARLNSIITDLANFQKAVELFETKYNYFPGDMAEATSFWGGTADGDGDGRIEYRPSAGTTLTEDLRAWQHLQLSEILAGDYSGTVIDGSNRYGLGTNAPEADMNGIGYWMLYAPYYSEDESDTVTFYDTSGSMIMIARVRSTSSPGSLIDSAAFTPEDADAIDIKADDGQATTGQLYYGRAFSHTGGTDCADDSFFATTASVTYSDINTTCSMIYWLRKD